MVTPQGQIGIPIVHPETLAEVSATIAESPGPVVFNAGPVIHPFGLPTAYCRMWQKILADHLASDGRPLPPDLENVELSPAEELALTETLGISLNRYVGIIEHDVADQVVVVRAGTPLDQLQEELAEVGQCLPIPTLEPGEAFAAANFYGPLIDEIGFNLPHGLASQCGSWRDWVLGMKVVGPDGVVAKCGSKAVKNVAGYDVQKLIIGARGTLGLIAEVTLKTFPLKALPESKMEFNPRAIGKPANWIQRVRRVDFEAALEAGAGHIAAFDRPSSTLWAIVPPGKSLARFEGDWVLRAGCGVRNLEFSDPTVIRLMHRTQQIFDPTGKMNPGEMGRR